MATNYNVDKTKSGVNGFGLPFCNTIYSVTLTASTDTTVAVPLTAAVGAPTATTFNKFMAVFSYSNAANVFVALNATATVPAGNTFAATTAELNPTAKMVKSTDVIHFISSGTPSITVAFYAIQE
jgi:hypothetical protein